MAGTEPIPFTKPGLTGRELAYVTEVLESGKLTGGGPFTHRCHDWLRSATGAHGVLLTHSCTAALEMAALLLDLQPGDEVIMPSFTFVSTANAFVLRGAVPVFVDIRQDTLNLDETLVEAAITPRTRAICPVHYAGVSCEMDALMDIARRYGIAVVEDAAQGIAASYKGRALGAIGDLGAFSFHATKNIVAGEGGALLTSTPALADAAEVIWEKGTDRRSFLRGAVDRYTWRRVGSSFLPPEMTAATLLAQLEGIPDLIGERLRLWSLYQTLLADAEAQGRLQRPTIPQGCEHNAHIYYVLTPDQDSRETAIARLKDQGIQATSHYEPLHTSVAGTRHGRCAAPLPRTEALHGRVLRLPLWVGMTDQQVQRVVESLLSALR